VIGERVECVEQGAARRDQEISVASGTHQQPSSPTAPGPRLGCDLGR
jgi:hypothetical protein